ncbi:hypothetical protein B0T14DRAFT_566003 [Immersiella caudata]|uniref:Clr5 domain-containing protein n=1 Tax=Immersiella caudata TaxID=314043 RepID=A0AA39WPF4_9PEZI|nr:hypothetical protein B0T14DRAFT_566003 [Immersiella caudata]
MQRKKGPGNRSRDGGNPYNLRSRGKPSSAEIAEEAEESIRSYLTDKTPDPDTTGENIGEWDGATNPVPPGVANAYWKRVYQRAGDKIRGDMLVPARNQITFDQANGRVFPDPEVAAQELAAELAKGSRDDGGDKGDDALWDQGAVIKLPEQFFAAMAEVYCDIAHRVDLAPEDLLSTSPQRCFLDGSIGEPWSLVPPAVGTECVKVTSASPFLPPPSGHMNNASAGPSEQEWEEQKPLITFLYGGDTSSVNLTLQEVMKIMEKMGFLKGICAPSASRISSKGYDIWRLDDEFCVVDDDWEEGYGSAAALIFELVENPDSSSGWETIREDIAPIVRMFNYFSSAPKPPETELEKALRTLCSTMRLRTVNRLRDMPRDHPDRMYFLDRLLDGYHLDIRLAQQDG